MVRPDPTASPTGANSNYAVSAARELATMLSTPGLLHDWKYESRRDAQQVLPWLWLGPMSALKNRELLEKRGITLLIAVRSSFLAKANFLGGHPQRRGVGGGGSGDGGGSGGRGDSKTYLPGNVGLPIHVTLDLPSTSGAPLISIFRTAAQLVDRNYLATLHPTLANHPDTDSIDFHTLVQAHQAEVPQAMINVLRHSSPIYPSGVTPPGSTLIFCESGNDCSAVVVASYIMQHYNASVVQAVQVVQNRRFSASFNDSNKFALASYEPIWRSMRQVENFRRSEAELHGAAGTVVPQQANKKRGFEETLRDEEIDLQEEMDVDDDDGGEERAGVAPFRDDD